MKRSRFFSILVAAVVLSLLMIAIPVTPALGVVTPTVTLISPATASGPPGTAVTLSCTWFTASQTYTVSFGGTAITSGNTGTGSFTASFTVPTNVRNNYAVLVTTTPDGSVSLTGGFTIIPGVTLSVSTGHVGDTVTVSGTGFYAGAGITVLYDGVSKGTIATTATGTFTGFTFTVPGSVKGVHTVRAQETSNPTTYYATDDFTVSPAITINPTTGSVGDTVTVTGNGFNGSSTITIYFDSASQTTTSTNSSGTFTATTFAVPSTSRGTHTVKAQDAGSNQATATFTVSTKITINPPSGPSGTTVTVTGTGFATGQTVTITYAGTSVVTTPSPVTTGSTGSFTATFVVPVRDIGTYEVRASAGSDVATANFQSTTNATISQTTTTSAPGYVGMSLTIEGVGFTPNHEITVTYATDPTTIATTNSDGSGNFTVTFTIPPSVAGEHTITVSDGTIIKNFDFYMETTPPPTPALTAPLADTKLKDNTFTWGAVEDVAPASNPISYDLQVAADSSFATPLVDKTGLAATSYTLLDEEKLESTSKDAPYYWRVRAVDAASNASAWSDPIPFTVGWSFSFTGWVVWVTLVVVAIVFFIIGLLVGRRAGGGGYY
jgi:hypothetical protein